MKRILCLIIASALCCSFLGCGNTMQELSDFGKVVGDAVEAVNNPSQTKTFTNNGVTLTLDSSFIDFTNTSKNDDNYAFLYANDLIGLVAIAEEKTLFSEQGDQWDLKAYGQRLASCYQPDAVIEKKDGYWYYETVIETDSGEKTAGLFMFLETSDHFWHIQATCPADEYEENQEIMWKYLTSIVFSPT